MNLPRAQINELHEAVKEFTNERTIVMAVPGQIRNSGRMIDAVQVTIGHNPTQKTYRYIYRGQSNGFRQWLKETIDKIEHK